MTEAPLAPSPLPGEGRGEGVPGHNKGTRAGLPSCPTRSIPPLSFPTFSIPPLSFPPWSLPLCHSRHF